MQKIIPASSLSIRRKFWELYRGLLVIGPFIFLILVGMVSIRYLSGGERWPLSYGVSVLVMACCSLVLLGIVYLMIFFTWIPGFLWLKIQERQMNVKLRENREDWMHPCGDIYRNSQWLISMSSSAYFFVIHKDYVKEIGKLRRIYKNNPNHGHKARIKTIHGSRWLKFGTKVAYKHTRQWINANVENRCKASSCSTCCSTGNVITEVE